MKQIPFLHNGWDIFNSAAITGDNPQFNLFKPRNIIETDYDNSRYHSEY